MELHSALRTNLNRETLLSLIRETPDLNIQNGFEQTPLHVAVWKKDICPEIILALIENGADVNIQDYFKHIPLHIAFINGLGPEVVQKLIECSDLNVQSKSGNTSLHYALTRNIDAKSLKEKKIAAENIYNILEREPNVDAQDTSGFSPLNWSLCHQVDPAIVHKIILQSSDMNIGDISGYTPLHFACRQIYAPDIVRTLVEKGADWTSLNITNETPFHFATRRFTLPRLLDTFPEEFDRMKKWPLTPGVFLYDVFPRLSITYDEPSLDVAPGKPLWSLTTDSKIIFRDNVADRMLDYLREGYTPFWSLIFRSVVSSRAFTLWLQLGGRRLIELPSIRVMDFLSDEDVGNLLLAYRPHLQRKAPSTQSAKRRRLE